MSRLNLCTLALAVMLLPVPAEAAGRSDLKAIIVQAQIPKAGDFMGFGFGSLWMMSSRRLIRVNPVDNSFVEIAIEGSFGRYRGIGIGEGAISIPDVGADIVYKVDPNKNEVVGQIPVQMDGSEGSIGVGEGAIWVVSGADRTLLGFDTGRGMQEATIALPSGGAGVVVDYGSVWVTSDRTNELYQIDPKTNTIVSVLRNLCTRVCCLDEQDGDVLTRRRGWMMSPVGAVLGWRRGSLARCGRTTPAGRAADAGGR